MPSERTVTAILLGIAAAGLLAVTGYNLWIAPPAEGLTAVRLEDSAAGAASFPDLDLPVVPDTEHPLDLNTATAEELDRRPDGPGRGGPQLPGFRLWRRDAGRFGGGLL